MHREWKGRQDPLLMYALKMKALFGSSTEDIALALECSPSRVYQLLQEARKRAREWLAE